ncbi:MFS transporter [Daejeonella oryzae]|uniref:MFS transporter n=1 Tax=Daejeonella oryzae TaxID=1122943 RepID=UPI00047D8C09|nr:MFS transporter [Daejeonella oryzae]
MDSPVPSLAYSKKTLRITVGLMFFLTGLCFASWASRIATIQQELGLSEAALGGILFSLPVGLMLSLPISGWLISVIGSRRLLVVSLILYSITLLSLGLAQNVFMLIFFLFLFGFFSNGVNISINTQAVMVEKVYQKPIMASFHGLWSLAGFSGAVIGSFMIGKGVTPSQHFFIIMALIIVMVAIGFRFLKKDSGVPAGQPIFVKPDKSLMSLGLIAFCSLICEGAMFDWSVVYFKKVVEAEGAWMGAGYTAFMGTMAMGRFMADWFSGRFGTKTTLQISGALTAIGLLIAVIYPQLLSAIVGFLLVGIGVSSVIPLVYSAAGKSKVMSPGMALAAVSTIGFLGFLLGPPLIGLIAGASSLRISFALMAFMGFCVILVSNRTKF